MDRRQLLVWFGAALVGVGAAALEPSREGDGWTLLSERSAASGSGTAKARMARRGAAVGPVMPRWP